MPPDIAVVTGSSGGIGSAVAKKIHEKSGGDLRLCAELTDSIPPQCTKPWLTVKGLDLSKFEGLRIEGGITWSPKPVLLLGAVGGGILEVSGLSKG